MKIKLPTFKRNAAKAQALAVARQSAAFYDIAAARGGEAVRGRTKDGYKRRNKIKGKAHGPTPPRTEPREKKAKYKPGTLGVSAIAESIEKDYGRIIGRSERKRHAKDFGVPFTRYYNGEAAKV